MILSDSVNKSNIQAPIFYSNRDKVIGLLLEEITFLNMLFYKTELIPHRTSVKIAVEKLENLLKALGYDDRVMTDSDRENMMKFIFNTIKLVKQELKEGAE